MKRRKVTARNRLHDLAKSSTTAHPELAPNSGRIALPVPIRAGVLWEDQNFVVTGEGLALKSTMEVLIPKDALLLVGEVAQTFPAEYSTNSFYVALDRAVSILLPEEFPEGLRKRRPLGDAARKPGEGN